MFQCRLCKFEVVLDDVLTMFPTGRGCLCIACFYRETETVKSMPKALRRELEAALAIA